ncbi:MAG: DUF58 domain-containing protein [Meiothermus silvanus]|nr:DUF58 domain-containing protein [Allomeiothermus silvanus]
MLGFWLFPLGLLAAILLAPSLVRGSASSRALKRRMFPHRSGTGRVRVALECPLPVYVRLEREGSGPLSLLPDGVNALAWPRWEWEEALLFSPRKRGEYPLPRIRVFARDLLGLREVEVRVNQESDRVLAYPEAFGLLSPDLRLTLLADGPEARGGLEDPSRFAGVRAYTPGDPLSRLHWNATALAASLLVAAEEANLAVGLSAGAGGIGLGRGALHLARILEVLARANPEQQARPVPIPPPGVNLLLVTQEASGSVIEGALRARARASRVHLIALPEGFYLKPGEKGRPVFGKTEGVLRLLEKRKLLEAEGVRVHILRGNENILRIADL